MIQVLAIARPKPRFSGVGRLARFRRHRQVSLPVDCRRADGNGKHAADNVCLQDEHLDDGLGVGVGLGLLRVEGYQCVSSHVAQWGVVVMDDAGAGRVDKGYSADMLRAGQKVPRPIDVDLVQEARRYGRLSWA